MTLRQLRELWKRPCRRDNARAVARITRLERKHAECLNPVGLRLLAHCRQALMEAR